MLLIACLCLECYAAPSESTNNSCRMAVQLLQLGHRTSTPARLPGATSPMCQCRPVRYDASRSLNHGLDTAWCDWWGLVFGHDCSCFLSLLCRESRPCLFLLRRWACRQPLAPRSLPPTQRHYLPSYACRALPSRPAGPHLSSLRETTWVSPPYVTHRMLRTLPGFLWI